MHKTLNKCTYTGTCSRFARLFARCNNPLTAREVEISSLHTMYVVGTPLIPPGIHLSLTLPFQNVRLKVVSPSWKWGEAVGWGGGYTVHLHSNMNN